MEHKNFIGIPFAELLVKPSERRSFLIALALVAIARAQAAFDFTYAVDDYRQIIDGLPSISSALIAQGRFGTWWLAEVLDAVGFDPMRAPFISLVASVFLSVWTANAVLRLWGHEMPGVIRALLIVVIAAHPYTSEILTFRGIAIFHVLSFALAMAAMVISAWGLGALLVSSLIFSAALTLYQVPINYISVFICFDTALRAIRHCIKGQDVPLAYSLRDRSSRARLVTFLGGFALYWLWLKISTFGLPPLQEMIPANEIPARLRDYGLPLLYEHFVSGTAYANPLVPKAILLIPLLMIAAAVLELLMRPTDKARSIVAAILALVAPFAAGLAMLGIPLFLTVLWLPPRVLVQISLVWAGVAVIALSVRRVLPQQMFVVALGLVAFSFIVENNEIFLDQARVATRDHNLALRLIARLEDQPNFSSMKAIAVVGKRSDVRAPIPTATHGLNDSNFEYQWAIAPMLTELSGITIRPAYAPELADAQVYCKNRAPWPAPDAAIIQAGVAIVCLPQP